MNKKETPVRKAKDVFLYNIQNNKYYDLRCNSNVLGHSPQSLATIVKNKVSASWNINQLDTIYHNRYTKLLNSLSGDRYRIRSAFSPEEFFGRLFLYCTLNNIKPLIHGKRMNDWFDGKGILLPPGRKKKKIEIYDMAEIYLDSTGEAAPVLPASGNGNISIANYYWYPSTDIPFSLEADIIILPELFNGNFKYITLLVKNQLEDMLKITGDINGVPSLYIASSLKFYSLLKKEKNRPPQSLNWKSFNCKGRLFSFKDFKNKQLMEDIRMNLYSKNIAVNIHPPYYNYFPLTLKDYQVKYLSGAAE